MPSVHDEFRAAKAAAYAKGWDDAYHTAFARGKAAGEASSHETIVALRKKIAKLLMNTPASLPSKIQR